jgi:hypothetical protein
MTQSKLSPRQARWLEALSEFDFHITYVPGADNVLADTLSRMYCNEPPGTVRAASEYVSMEEDDTPSTLLLNFVTAPVYTGTPLFLGATEAHCSARIAACLIAPAAPTDPPPVHPTGRWSVSNEGRAMNTHPGTPPVSPQRTPTQGRHAAIDRDITPRSTPTIPMPPSPPLQEPSTSGKTVLR